METQKNSENQGQTSGEMDAAGQPEEHETHTAALVFLTIVVLVVSYIALSAGNGINLPSLDDGSIDDEFNIQNFESEEELMQALRDQPSHGSAVPQSDVATTDTNSLELIPATLFIDEAGITQNRLVGDEGNQQSVIFTTERGSGDLYEAYTTWLAENNHEVYQELEEAEGFKLAANGPARQQLTVSVLNPTDERPQTRVIIDYIQG